MVTKLTLLTNRGTLLPNPTCEGLLWAPLLQKMTHSSVKLYSCIVPLQMWAHLIIFLCALLFFLQRHLTPPDLHFWDNIFTSQNQNVEVRHTGTKVIRFTVTHLGQESITAFLPSTAGKQISHFTFFFFHQLQTSKPMKCIVVDANFPFTTFTLLLHHYIYFKVYPRKVTGVSFRILFEFSFSLPQRLRYQ